MLALKFILEATDRATAPIRRLQKTIDSITAPARRARESIRSLGVASGLPRLAAAASRVTSSFGSLTRTLRSLRSSFLYLTGTATAALYGMNRFAQASDRSVRNAEKSGLPVEEWQRLAYAAERAGMQEDRFADIAKELSKNMVDAALGSEQAAVWFSRAGVEVADASGKLKPLNALLYELANRFASMPDGQKKAALAMGLFKQSGLDMIAMLNGGAAGLKRAARESESLGLVNAKAAREGQELNKSFIGMFAAIRGVVNSLMTSIGPVLKEILDRFRAWTAANRELIASKLGEFVKRLAAGLPDFLASLVSIGKAVWRIVSAVDAVVQRIGGWQVVVYGLAAVMATKLTVSIAGIILSLGRLSLALLTTPAGWLALAIGGLVLAGIALVKNWDWISKKWSEIWAGIKGAGTGAIDWVREKITSLTQWMKDLVVTLDNLTPDWVKRFTLPGAAVKFLADGVRGSGPPVVTAVPTGRNRFGGEIHLKIDAGGTRTRVTKLTSDNNDVAIDVDTGMSIVNP